MTTPNETTRKLKNQAPHLDYYPHWLDNLADDVILQGAVFNGELRGAEQLLPAWPLRLRSPILFSTISLTPDCVAAQNVSRRICGHAGQPADCSLISPKGNAILASSALRRSRPPQRAPATDPNGRRC